MRAAFYETSGPAKEVLKVGELPTPQPGPGEVRVKLAFSGANPSDVKSRSGASNRGWNFPLTIPHSDGAGTVDAVGAGVDAALKGRRVWVYNGQWERAHGTAAESIVLPAAQAVPLPDNVSLEAGASIGIPLMTAFHAVSLRQPCRQERDRLGCRRQRRSVRHPACAHRRGARHCAHQRGGQGRHRAQGWSP